MFDSSANKCFKVLLQRPGIKEASINHLVYDIVSPVLERGRAEKEVSSGIEEEEHVVVDLIELSISL